MKMKLSWIGIRSAFLLTGVGSLFIGVIFLIIGFVFNFSNLIEAVKWLISIGVATVSIGVATHSVVIAEQSDEKLRIIEKMNFNRLYGLLRERRLSLRGKMLGLQKVVLLEIKNKGNIQDLNLIRLICEFEIYYCFSIWQSLVYLREINSLKNRIPGEDKKLILHVIRNLFSDLKDGLIFLKTHYKHDYKLNGNYPGQIQSMLDIVTNFGVHDEEKQQYEELVVFKHFLLEKIKITIQPIPKKQEANKPKKKKKTKK